MKSHLASSNSTCGTIESHCPIGFLAYEEAQQSALYEPQPP
jgi:hypothetical protein